LARVGIVSPDIYVPFAPDARSESLLLARASGNARALVRPIDAVLSKDQSGIRRATVVGDDRQFIREESLFLVRLIGAFGLVALGLAASGIFGVLSQSISQRTTEFGVRMAVGASSGDVLWMVIMREAKLIVAAIATGAAGTILVSRVVFAELVTVSAADPRMWITVAALCGGFGAVAAALATYRIVRLDPWTILRNG
jgi:ABC-type antimicrobial peptide transport system permease subunit